MEHAITPQNIVAIEKKLAQEFKDIFGEDAFQNAYIEDFNNKKSMLSMNFNRNAQPYLFAYFIAFALGKSEELQRLLLSKFAKEARKIGPGNQLDQEGKNPHFTHHAFKHIVQDLRQSVNDLWENNPATQGCA